MRIIVSFEMNLPRLNFLCDTFRNEKIELKNLYHIKDDNKVSIDESSCNDYRLRIESKHLRKFVKRFDKKAERERVDDLSREFMEELVV